MSGWSLAIASSTACGATATLCRLSDFTVTPFHSVPSDNAGTTHFGYLFDLGLNTLYDMGYSSPGVAVPNRRVRRVAMLTA